MNGVDATGEIISEVRWGIFIDMSVFCVKPFTGVISVTWEGRLFDSVLVHQ